MSNSGFNSITQRLSTGAIFVGVIIGALWYSSYASFVVFGIAMYFSLMEFLKMTLGKELTKVSETVIKVLSMALYAATYFYAIGRLSVTPLLWITPYLITIAIVALYNKGGDTFRTVSTAVMSLIYIVLPFSLIHIMINNGGDYNGLYLLGIFFLIWVNDSFAYLFGVSLGKHRLWERISPKKSWEGFIGGGICTIAISCIIAHFFFQDLFLEVAGVAAIIVIFGTFGDLFESQLKRQFNIKDSGNALPGHGGFLDRFDSFLFIVPVAMVYLELVG